MTHQHDTNVEVAPIQSGGALKGFLIVNRWPDDTVEDVALRIDHVGSTSFPGLAAKPVIDMDIVVRHQGDVRSVIDRLASLGYRWRGSE